MDTTDLEKQPLVADVVPQNEYMTRREVQDSLNDVKRQLDNVVKGVNVALTAANREKEHNVLVEVFKWAMAYCAYNLTGYLIYIILPVEVTAGYVIGRYLYLCMFGNA